MRVKDLKLLLEDYDGDYEIQIEDATTKNGFKLDTIKQVNENTVSLRFESESKKCLVDTFKIYDEDGKDVEDFNNQVFVEMDGFNWDSLEYDTLEEFLQSIINHAYAVAMGRE